MESIFTEILIVSAVATLVVTSCHALRLPSIVGFILTGIAIGPSGGKLVSSLPSAYTLTELAGIILMFTIGLECNFSKLKELRHAILRLGTLQVLFTIVIIFFLGFALLGLEPPKLLLWGFAISMSSTALVLKLLNEYGDLHSPQGHNSLGILLFQDLAVIPMVLVLPLLASSTATPASFSMNSVDALNFTAKITAVVLLLFFAARFGLSRLLEIVIRTKNQELFFFSIIFVCLGTGFIFHQIGLSLTLGAFVAGVIISESAFGHHTIATFNSLRNTFLGLFFVTLGMLLDLNFMLKNLGSVLGVGFAFFVIKTVVITLVCLFQKIPLATSLITGLVLCQVGEFSFLLVSSGMKLGIFSEVENQYFLATSVLSMIASPFIYQFAPRFVHRYAKLQWAGLGFESGSLEIAKQVRKKLNLSDGAKLDNTQEHSNQITQTEVENSKVKPIIVIGYGIAGQNVAEALTALKIPFKVIEINYETVKKQKKKGISISFGDASQKHVLIKAGIQNAQMVVIAASGSDSAVHILQNIRSLHRSIPVVLRSQYLRDLARIPKEPSLRTVVAEIETASELVAHVLKEYGVSSRTVFEYTAKVRTQLNSVAEAVSGSRYADLDLPSWEVLSSIRPVALKQSDYAVGKTLGGLELPRIAKVSVAAIYRSGEGTFVPDGSVVLCAEDIIHLIGQTKNLSFAESFLESGLSLR